MTIAELKRFAQRVDRLCDFLIDRSEKLGVSEADRAPLYELKEQATGIHTGTDPINIGLEGLSEFVGRR